MIPHRPVYLGFGLQSGGTTLVSYCFLQRSDMSGVLDWFHDRLPEPPPRTAAGTAHWCKCTVASFRAQEVIGHFEDLGFDPRPVLIVRDVRRAFDSLIGKPYGRNATTAEDPSLRTRFRRFLDDWEHFRAAGLPVMTLEAFTAAPEAQLRRVCAGMGLDWDDAMLTWPHPPARVWNGKGGNQGFVDRIGQDLQASLRPAEVTRALRRIGRADLEWLDRTFAEYNRDLGYPAQLSMDQVAGLPEGAQVPSLQNAGRYPAMRVKAAVHRLLPGLQGIRRRLGRART